MSLSKFEPDFLSGIIKEVLSEIQGGDRKRRSPNSTQHGVFDSVDHAVDAAQQAHQTLVVQPLEKRKEVIANIRKRVNFKTYPFAFE